MENVPFHLSLVTSNSPAAPMPPPMHIVATTRFAPSALAGEQGVADQPLAGHAVGMADGDRAAVDVESVVRDAELVAAVDAPARRTPR